MSESDGFLSRWARRKARVQSGVAEPVEAPVQDIDSPRAALTHPGPPASAVPTAIDTQRAPEVEPIPLPTMEDVASLTRSSDYSRFVQPGVDSGVSNAAMKKLFSDPHFNVMDGLDTYIDDYGKPDPIPMSMLRRMNQAKFLGLFDDAQDEAGKENNGAPSKASTDGAGAPAVAESAPLEAPRSLAPVSEARPDDDPDLRLQQDDGAGRPGPAPSPGS